MKLCELENETHWERELNAKCCRLFPIGWRFVEYYSPKLDFSERAFLNGDKSPETPSLKNLFWGNEKLFWRTVQRYEEPTTFALKILFFANAHSPTHKKHFNSNFRYVQIKDLYLTGLKIFANYDKRIFLLSPKQNLYKLDKNKGCRKKIEN